MQVADSTPQAATALFSVASKWGDVDKCRCLLVEAVSEASIAWLAGVRTGDLLVAVNGKVATELGQRTLELVDPRDQQGIAVWEFAKQEFLNAERVALCFGSRSPCVGIRVGISAEAACEKLRGAFTAGPISLQRQPFYVYWKVWEAGYFELLRHKTPRWGMSAASPFTLFNAVARLELGEAGAILGVAHYINAEEGWTTDFQSLARFYVAKALASEDPHPEAILIAGSLLDVEDEISSEDAVVELFRLAWSLDSSSPRMRAVASNYLDESELAARPMPSAEICEYELPVITASAALLQEHAGSGPHSISLSGVASRSPVVLLVMLGGYRANGPYSDLMKQWVKWATAYGELGLKECHVITSDCGDCNTTVVEEKRSWWLDGERRALQKTAIAVLHDEGGVAQAALEEALGEVVDVSPFALLVRGRAVIDWSLGDREFTDVSVFDALRKPGTG